MCLTVWHRLAPYTKDQNTLRLQMYAQGIEVANNG